MNHWEYLDAQGAAAAIGGRDLLARIASGQLSAATPVRRRGKRRWRPAGLTGAFDAALYPPLAFDALPEFDARDYVERSRRSYPPARPWVRLWARVVDLAVFAVLIDLAVMASAWRPGMAGESAIGFAIPLAWVVIEAIALSTLGTTPGKALLRVSVRRRDGGRLDFSRSLNRAFDVWFKGLGMALPVVALVTEVLAYRRLTRDGVTSWDEAGDVLVAHERIGHLRIAATVAILLLGGWVRAA